MRRPQGPSADFSTGRGGFLQLLSVSLSPCCRSHPARGVRRLSQPATSSAAFALSRKARPLEWYTFGATCAFACATAWGLASIPRMLLSMGFRDSVSFLPAIRATRLLTFTLAGLAPAEHASLYWTHNRTCKFPSIRLSRDWRLPPPALPLGLSSPSRSLPPLCLHQAAG